MADQMPELSSHRGEGPDVVRLCACVAHITDVGRRRSSNQDNYLLLPLDHQCAPQDTLPVFFGIDDGRLVVAVADGMGGHFGGEIASRMCVESLAQEVVKELQAYPAGEPDFSLSLQKSVESAHRAVYAHARTYSENITMGTTVTAALLHGTRAEFAQVGDSRAYLFRAGHLVLLTQDQTIGNQMRNSGEDSSKVSAQIRDMLVQAVGAQPEISVIMSAVDLEPGDFLLVCCDGLYKAVAPGDIVDILELNAGVYEKSARLVMRANECGGPDNITVILIEIFQAESTESTT